MTLAISSHSFATNTYTFAKVTEKVSSVSEKCFEFLKECLLFPTRYIGSKTWSIPGFILRTPYLLFKRLFVRSSTPLSEELFGSGYRFFFEKTLSKDELQPYLAPLCSIAFINKTESKFLLPGWKPIAPKDLNVSLEGVQEKDTYFSDPSTGFKVSVLEKEKEVIIVFGAMELHELKTEEQPKCLQGKTGIVVRSLLGEKVSLCHQADAFVKQVKSDPLLRKKSITLAGMCFGGPQASFAALKHGLPAVCGNSFPLSAGLQQELGSEVLSEADKYITNISVQGDFLTNSRIATAVDLVFSGIGIKTPGNFGRRYLVPSAYASSMGTHAYLLGSVLNYLGHGYRTLPETLTTTSLN